MSRRNWNPLGHFASNGLLFGAFSWITTNIGTDPDVTLTQGLGGLTGPDAVGSVPNSGPTFVHSITKTANNGEFLITFQDGYRAMWHASGTIYSDEDGPGVADTLDLSEPINEGLGHETRLTMLATVCIDADTPTETAGRRCSVFVVLKDSGSGA